MEKYPCTCGGENPNCFRCDGTGLVESLVLPLRSDGRIHPKPASVQSVKAPRIPTKKSPVAPPAANKRFYCAKCEIFFEEPIAFIYHARTQHPKPKQAKKNRTPQDLQQQTEKAPSHKQVSLEALRESQKLMEEARRAIKQLRRSFPRSQLCYSCFGIFKTDVELVEHHKSAHPAESTPALVITKPKNKKKKSKQSNKQSQHFQLPSVSNSKRRVGSNRYDNVQLPKTQSERQNISERRMDATYGMGGFARDHGQFGSAPAYDGMDDESAP